MLSRKRKEEESDATGAEGNETKDGEGEKTLVFEEEGVPLR